MATYGEIANAIHNLPMTKKDVNDAMREAKTAMRQATYWLDKSGQRTWLADAGQGTTGFNDAYVVPTQEERIDALAQAARWLDQVRVRSGRAANYAAEYHRQRKEATRG